MAKLKVAAAHLVEVPWVEAVHREAVQKAAAVCSCLVGTTQGAGRQVVGGHCCCLLLVVVVVLGVVGALRILGGHQVGDLGGLWSKGDGGKGRGAGVMSMIKQGPTGDVKQATKG